MRSRWVCRPGHPKANDLGMVNVNDLGDDVRLAETSTGAAIMADRWREGSAATDGTDIGSRSKEREYMKVHGLAHAKDFTQTWQKAEQERAARRSGVAPVPRDLKEQVGRIAYELRGKKR